ncbi:hypothetical protein ACHFJ0_12060 [Paracoccus sp. NGMCC 1.201697]|uniref:Dihydroorotate dehydrogenase electron transfer subunit iron-sulphur cluster binding domain-containing protein n=1 Tax=Paracoccus broussonetiae subsp. drimophilus TaxID=3373869 RepID=A0ABW7LLE7_9RHOB
MRFLNEIRISGVRSIRQDDQWRWLAFDVSGLPPEARPGQTVVFQDGHHHSPFCRTATVDARPDGGAALLTRFGSGDVLPCVGADLTVWSNETPAAPVGPGALIVTTRSFRYRVAPHAAEGAEILVEEDLDQDLWAELRQRTDQGRAWPSVFLALDPLRLQGFVREFPTADPFIFANMDMSCGVGACRSCHVNLWDNKDGEASCRVGPWFALPRVDLVRLQFSSAPFI